MAAIKLGQGTYANYAALESKSQYEVYFCTDTHQIFVGTEEYTKSAQTLNAEPTASVAGDKGRLYAYNGNLYLCGGGTAGSYVWTRVANINDTQGTVTSVSAEDGVETADGNPITATGTIKHSVPSGASTLADDLSDQTPAFGSTFAIDGFTTDKFGHVTGRSQHAVTIPTQTPVGVATTTAPAATVGDGDSFEVVVAVAKDQEAGATDHDIVYTTKTFTLTADEDTTYEISSTTEGVVTLTSSAGSASTALINGWNDLAKKSDITAVLQFKGTVATESALPTTDVKVGDVWYVTDTDSEYVCIATDPSISWEQLGPIVDLSAYATTAYVQEQIAWHEF